MYSYGVVSSSPKWSSQQKLHSQEGPFRGCSISPYIFILCANVFSGLIKQEDKRRKIHGIQVTKSALVISHLFFMDDNLLFARSNSMEAECVLDILHRYQMSSGSIVNLDKSQALLILNVCENVKE